MDEARLGSSLRAPRIRLNLRQSDLGARIGVPRNTISEIERGRFSHVTLTDLVRIATFLGADLDVRLRWRGETLDRLLDAAHAATMAAAVARFDRLGWSTAVEVSFSIWGERGSIDLLAWHETTRSLLVVEVKSVIPDLQAMLQDLDRKTRLAPEIAGKRGWRPITTSRLLVVAESPTSRGRVRQHQRVFDAALPARSATIRTWLREPRGALHGLMFLSNAAHGSTPGPTWRRERVARRRPRAVRPDAA